MSFKNTIKKHHIGIVLILIITVTFIYFGKSKAGYFIDEIYTYGLSNSHFAPYISDIVGGDMEDQIITRDDLISYVTVDKGEAFDFASVYYNQECDVHPPLFYWIFNIASSLTPGVFSKYTGLGLNYIIFLATLFMLAKVCDELVGKGSARYWAISLYGLSYLGISTAVYIRMYELLTLITLLLIYFIVKLLHEGKYKYCILSGVAIFLGMMTQYYFVIYAFFICLGMFIFLFVKKEYKLLSVFSLCAFTGIGLMVLVFPACIKHIFVGNGQVVSGGVAVSNILAVKEWIPRLWDYFMYIGRGITVTCIVVLALLIVLIIQKKIKISLDIVIVVIPAILTWAMIAIIAAVKEERYIYNIIPAFVLLAAYLVNQRKLNYTYLVVATAASFMFIGCNYEYLRPQCITQDTILDEHTGSKCVYITDNKFAPLTADFAQLIKFDEVFTTSNTSSAKLKEYVKDSKEIVVYVDSSKEWSSGFDPIEKMDELKSSLNYTEYELLFDNSLSNVFVLK